ncbi:hypothetical protein [Pelosinus sp. IPA-1]|uniref:McrC family protein n=1 Tax=Pelosinus sp. IPA-1 TaxID=3029569 RepID=UPI0024361F75|nr:hypothetical protein [Pelosinus sp. IPA-1]GMA98823.1 hypothetical protein PIPA1_16230 [Pelosinus sp. IPA-1]
MANRKAGSIKTIIVQECYQEIPICDNDPHALTNREANEMASYIKQSNLDNCNFVWGRQSLRIINYVGYIRLSTVAIEILPKTGTATGEHSRKVLLDMLYHSRYCEVDYSAISELKDVKHNLFEIFGYLFAENLKKELLRGAAASYMLVENNLTVLKGRLQVSKQISNLCRGTGKAYCQYDEFTIDNALNRILKWAALYLIHKVRNERTVALLKFCLLHFDEVDGREVSSVHLDRVKFDRTNQRFLNAFTLAKMFLLDRSPISSTGTNQNFALLFSMSDLFEKYISVVMKRYIDYQVYAQHAKYKLLVNERTERGTYSLQPDLVLCDNECEKLIVDTKWKAISDSSFRHGVKREDYFQMYAYLTRYSTVDTVILLYPHNSNITRGSAQMLESYYLEDQPYKRLRVYTVDYECIEKTVEDLKKIVSENMANIYL